MTRKPSLSALAAISLLCVVLLAACSSGNPFITSVTIAPTTASIDAASVGSGSTQQFTASALYSDGSTKDVTSTTQWASSNSGVASIDANGLATAATPPDTASVTITGTAGGHSSTATLTVVHGIQSIAVTPLAASVAAGLPQQYVAMGTYSTVGGTTTHVDDVSKVATWTSGTPLTATIDGNGLATTLKAGTTNITATIGTVVSSPVAVLTVTAAIPQTLQITPATPSITLGTSTNLTALELKSDGTTGPLTGTVTWAIAVPADCSTAGAVSLGATGVNGNEAVGGVLVGSCKVTATEGTLKGTATVTVVTGTSHFAFVADGGNIEGFKATATTAPYLAPLTPPLVAASTTQQAVVHPNGKYIYSIGSNGDVHLYTVTSAGVVAPVTPEPSPLPNFGGSSLIYGAIDPTGRFFVATDLSGDTVRIAAISSADGTLGAVSITTLTGAGSAPERLAIDRLGKYVYVTSDDNQVYAYSITGTPTAPTLTAIANYPTGLTPTGVAVDPANKLVYVANGGDGTAGSNSVSIYKLNSASGALTAQLPNFPVPGTPTFVWNVVVDPTSSYLYVLDAGDSSSDVPGSVYGFLITDKTTGALGAAVTGSGAATGMEPTGLSMDATGSLIASDNNFGTASGATNGSISLLTIGTGGALTAKTPLELPTGSQPLFVTFLNAP